MDGVLSSQLESHQIAGAVVSVVKDGKLIFTKGYGYSDLETQTPVQPDQTLFRTGSVTKPVVWTAVMQLVERGLLDLDADVQDYLDFPIPETYPQPITLAHLLTHTAGFEEAGLGTFVREREQMAPLSEYLRENIPARIYPPGQIAAYSNYSAALAGYLIERTSGMPYEEYILENIFRRLEMDNSTLYQPLPPGHAKNLSKGYIREAGRYREGRFEYVQASPAGALSSTAYDMANFMIAHLQEGRYQDVRILQESTAQEMHSRQFAHHPEMGGMTYGWMEMDSYGQRVIWHGGNTVFFHTILILLPDHNTGLYASYNSVGGAEASILLMNAFMEKYFSLVRPPVSEQFSADPLERFTGSYIPSRHNVTSIAKFLLLAGPVSVSQTPEGMLRIGGLGFEPTYWMPAGENIFHNIETPQILLFDQSEQGRFDRFYLSDFSPIAFLRAPWHGTPGLHYLVLGITLPVFLVALLAIPVSRLSTLSYRRSLKDDQPLPTRLASWLTWLFSLLALTFTTGVLVMLADPEIFLGLPPWSGVLSIISWTLPALALAMFVLGVLAALRGYWEAGSRMLYGLVTLSALVFVLFMAYWNLFF